uniref:Ig-like domain-containing protein n=1 Tax=Xenopus tropicalis TaxID=8364 RepID=A0A6I8RBH3_XENTR
MVKWHFLSNTLMFKQISVCVGAAARPVIFFSPNWNPISEGESVTLSCNVAPTAHGNLGYSWYRYGERIPGDQQRLVIQAARVTDSGNYQCQAGASERSDSVRLDIRTDLLILQAPPAVHEGDSLSLRCHSRPGYVTRNPVFYKDNKPIGPPVSGSELQIGRVNVTVSGTYGCEKDIYYKYNYHTYSAKQYILVSFGNVIQSIELYIFFSRACLLPTHKCELRSGDRRGSHDHNM